VKKKILISLSIFLLILIAVGCKTTEQNKSTKTTLSELQISACNSADAAKTCDTRLAEVGIVLKEDCCKELGKCC
jgi:hypothetical protein